MFIALCLFFFAYQYKVTTNKIFTIDTPAVNMKSNCIALHGSSIHTVEQ